MSRDRLDTSELEGALGPLAGPPPRPTVPAGGAGPTNGANPPPLKGGPPSGKNQALAPAGLFDPVKVQGEDEIGRAIAEDKVAILRRKVIALEQRIQQIRDSWQARDTELDAAIATGQREKKGREDAEAAAAKLNAFVAMKKAEVETYHERVQEALREQAKRESDAAKAHTEREKDLVQGAARREQELQDRASRRDQEMREAMGRREQELQESAATRHQELQQGGARLLKEASDGHVRRERELTEQLARRERELSDALGRREKELVDEHTRLERNSQQDFMRREQELMLRLETAETELRDALERTKSTPPPPPPPIDATELDEMTKSLTTAGRSLVTIIKGQMPNDLVQESLRDSLKQIKWSLEQIASLKRDLG